MYCAIAPEPAGLELNLEWDSDYSHDGWNDVQAACRLSYGGFNFTNIQMAVVYNSNYAPYLTGANLGSKRELLREFLQLNPDIPEAFAEDLDVSSLDARSLCPGDDDEEQERYEMDALRNENFQKRGYYVRMCVFFSLIKAHRLNDPRWSAWKKLLEWASRNLGDQDDVDAQRVQEKTIS